MKKHDSNKASTQDIDFKKAVRGWCMYDWANSAFATSISTAIMPVYFVALFQNAFGSESTYFGFTFTGSSTWALGVAISTAIVAVSSPLLGVIADSAEIKKKLLWIYTLTGAIFTAMAILSPYSGAPWLWVIGCYVLANVGFAGGLVFYNSFLPHLGPAKELDSISSRGFAYGYVGGGLLLTIHLAALLITGDSEHLDLVTRLSIGSVGLWWFGWAIWTFKTVPEPRIDNPVDNLNPKSALFIAFSRLKQTCKQLTKFRILVLYLVAYLIFNDGIQTVLSVAGAFGPDTLGISLISNVGTILLVQFVAAGGAILFSKVSDLVGTKKALISTLCGWCIVITFAIGFAPLTPTKHTDFDYQMEYGTSGRYILAMGPELSEERKSDVDWEINHKNLIQESTLTSSQVSILIQDVRTDPNSRFSISINGGSLDKIWGIGPKHPSLLADGPIDWWPRMMRDYIWKPLGLSVDSQWLLLGILVGLVLGGSQALARSLFAYFTPQNRSGEFFGFFGLVGRASAVFGPMLYMISTSFYDARVAILLILILIIIGMMLLTQIDVKKGRAVAVKEDKLALDINRSTN